MEALLYFQTRTSVFTHRMTSEVKAWTLWLIRLAVQHPDSRCCVSVPNSSGAGTDSRAKFTSLRPVNRVIASIVSSASLGLFSERPKPDEVHRNAAD